jgi:hypothetical protein
LFSTGGMFGAALVALLLRAGVPPALQLAGIAAVLVLAVLWGSRGMLAVHPVAVGPAGLGQAAHFAWPRGLLLVLGLLVLAGMLAEGVMYDWCVLYLQQELGLPADRAAWGYAAFSGAMALARFGGDALRERFAERRLLAAGAGMAALAMAAVLLAATPALAFVGFRARRCRPGAGCAGALQRRHACTGCQPRGRHRRGHQHRLQRLSWSGRHSSVVWRRLSR